MSQAPAGDKPAPDWERIAREAALKLARGDHTHGSEADLVALFMEQEATGRHEPMIGAGPHDTIAREMKLRFGRADIVVFHVDGGATVIEAKDGAQGYHHVVGGIGQASLYAAQLAITRGAIKYVRKALLWSSTGDAFLDAVIDAACRQANTIPLEWPAMRVLMANRDAVAEALKP